MGIQRGGHADCHRVHIADKAEITGRTQTAALHFFLKCLADNVADIVMARIDAFHFVCLDVKADGRIARACEFHRKGKSHIAQTDNADFRRFVVDFIQQFRFHIRHFISLIFTVFQCRILFGSGLWFYRVLPRFRHV